MKICPKCAAKYEDWARECSDCRVFLEKIAKRNEAFLEEIDPQPLMTVKDYGEGDEIAAYFETERIFVVRNPMGSENSMDAHAGGNAFGETLYVDKGDYKKAVILLAEKKEAEQPVECLEIENPETNEVCFQENLYNIEESQLGKIISIAILVVFIAVAAYLLGIFMYMIARAGGIYI